MDERQSINPKAIENLVHQMIADGRPIEEQCRVEVTPPHIVCNLTRTPQAPTLNRYEFAPAINVLHFQGPPPTPTEPDESLLTHVWDSNGTDHTEILRGVFQADHKDTTEPKGE